jgi:hypothetical protein
LKAQDQSYGAILLVMSFCSTCSGLLSVYISKDKRTFAKNMWRPRWGTRGAPLLSLEQLRAVYRFIGVLLIVFGAIFFVTGLYVVILEAFTSRR